MAISRHGTVSRLTETVAVGACGALAAQGFTSAEMPWAFVLAAAAYLHLAASARPYRGALLGLIFGTVFNLVGFSWLYPCIERFSGFGPVAAGTLYLVACIEVAMFSAAFGFLLPILAKNWGERLLVAPALWVAFEWLRTVWPSWGWNLAGYVWGSWPWAIQIADLGGVYGLSFVTIFLACLLAFALGRSALRQRLAALAVGGGVFGMLVGYGAYRLAEAPLDTSGERLRIGLVQPAIPQEIKWRTDRQDDIFSTLEGLTRELAGQVDLAVWPESALPDYFQRRADLRARLGTLVGFIGAPLLLGADMQEPDGGNGWRHFNSALLVNGGGEVEHRYDKHHLIAFGEYLPLRGLLPASLQPLSSTSGDLSAGQGPHPMPWDRLPIGVSICFEAIFPDEVRQLAVSGARVLINLSNDAWFGEGIKHQHLTMARLRAIETRMPMVRVANTGITAAFDAWGRELTRIPSDSRAAVVVAIHPVLLNSLYKSIAPAIPIAVFILALGPAALRARPYFMSKIQP